jgi:hypothetical protein
MLALLLLGVTKAFVLMLSSGAVYGPLKKKKRRVI